ncbi:NAD(P)-dependent oxidoreductase [Psychrosphaera saromensis]|uniref:dTDP-4-dehydrorhamnose reductase n=1 Tax=Psychrosphaera saromensis TaxID=716813 RepID=A0A2S7UYF6_9GAMM|nr:dTDP-4-dehydrorhamnose reductase [Psychrosphaera saromensis]PQJ54745.1 dTDP-4-dehydrorhamnose reductase [Psychrosphaera saromensis]GHB57489.1 NAD(P)-dependent oxidoreductase [Psychrosphaera saromensis]GLQ14021.1 NAD(P)-dependent oxidoreductase [Psychrosphaera saromensis]
MKAVVIGRNGQVAWELQHTLPANTEALVLGSSDVNIIDLNDLRAKVEAFQPNVIINASAYTAVDKAESDIDAAYTINRDAVNNIAVVAKELNARLIHISTDFIFDGTKNTAYKVNDLTNPVSVYGASKLAGELAIKDIYPENSTIVRTSWVYSSHGSNFVKTMLRLMSEKDELSVVGDQIGCPTYARGLAEFIWQLCCLDKVEHVYNWTDLGVASWYDFAVEIQRIAIDNDILSRSIPITPIKSEQYPTPATRPHFSLLDVKDSQSIMCGDHWGKNLIECLRELR